MKIFILLALAACVLGQKLIADPELIREVNTHASWKAGINEIFDGVDLTEAPRYLGLLKRPSSYFAMPLIQNAIGALPESFDARVNWAGRIIPVRDQASCGSCWAFGATEALSDRFNIKYPQNPVVMLSPQQLVSCDTTSFGCQGGYPDKCWLYMEKGVVPDSCYPYTSGGGSTGTCLIKTPKAGDPCPSKNGTQVVYHAEKAGRLPANEQAIMQEMYETGPIEMGFHVYQDFFNYKSGVYYHQSGGLAGGHAIKCLGWGYDAGSKLKYWICANSWGSSWGQQGYFWIKKGTDECGIESWFTVSGQAGNIDK